MFSWIRFVRCVRMSTSFGKTSDFAGSSNTSSKVRPSRIGPTTIAILLHARKYERYPANRGFPVGKLGEPHNAAAATIGQFTTLIRKPQAKPAYSNVNPDSAFKKGFSRRSSPIVDAGPWSGNTR